MAITGQDRITIDHETIRRWAEEREGYPATVRGTHRGTETGVLRVGFEGDEDLEAISWDDFFTKFEAKALAMRYHDEPEESGSDRFHEFFRRR